MIKKIGPDDLKLSWVGCNLKLSQTVYAKMIVSETSPFFVLNYSRFIFKLKLKQIYNNNNLYYE